MNELEDKLKKLSELAPDFIGDVNVVSCYIKPWGLWAVYNNPSSQWELIGACVLFVRSHERAEGCDVELYSFEPKSYYNANGNTHNARLQINGKLVATGGGMSDAEAVAEAVVRWLEEKGLWDPR